MTRSEMRHMKATGTYPDSDATRGDYGLAVRNWRYQQKRGRYWISRGMYLAAPSAHLCREWERHTRHIEATTQAALDLRDNPPDSLSLRKFKTECYFVGNQHIHQAQETIRLRNRIRAVKYWTTRDKEKAVRAALWNWECCKCGRVSAWDERGGNLDPREFPDRWICDDCEYPQGRDEGRCYE